MILSIPQVFDVNMNTTVASLSGSFTAGPPKHTPKNGLSTIQGQVSGTAHSVWCSAHVSYTLCCPWTSDTNDDATVLLS